MSKTLMNKSDYFFNLPQEQIAQTPAVPRDSCKMLCVDKKNPLNYSDKIFSDIYDMLKPGDVLVMNNASIPPHPSSSIAHWMQSSYLCVWIILTPRDLTKSIFQSAPLGSV